MAIGETDIEREQDVEELRRIAVAQPAQIRQPIENLRRKCGTLSFYTGNKGTEGLLGNQIAHLALDRQSVGVISLDNNTTERGIRGPVVGRRNHFGSKSRRGTEVAATLYTVMETAKLHNIDPAAYLRAAPPSAARPSCPIQFAAQRSAAP